MLKTYEYAQVIKQWIFKAGNQTNQIELQMRKLRCHLKSGKFTE